MWYKKKKCICVIPTNPAGNWHETKTTYVNHSCASSFLWVPFYSTMKTIFFLSPNIFYAKCANCVTSKGSRWVNRGHVFYFRPWTVLLLTIAARRLCFPLGFFFVGFFFFRKANESWVEGSDPQILQSVRFLWGNNSPCGSEPAQTGGCFLLFQYRCSIFGVILWCGNQVLEYVFCTALTDVKQLTAERNPPKNRNCEAREQVRHCAYEIVVHSELMDGCGITCAPVLWPAPTHACNSAITRSYAVRPRDVPFNWSNWLTGPWS